MHGLKDTLKKILSVSNFKCKERKKNYTRDDGGGVQLTLYVWRELGLEKNSVTQRFSDLFFSEKSAKKTRC